MRLKKLRGQPKSGYSNISPQKCACDHSHQASKHTQPLHTLWHARAVPIATCNTAPSRPPQHTRPSACSTEPLHFRCCDQSAQCRRPIATFLRCRTIMQSPSLASAADQQNSRLHRILCAINLSGRSWAGLQAHSHCMRHQPHRAERPHMRATLLQLLPCLAAAPGPGAGTPTRCPSPATARGNQRR